MKKLNFGSLLLAGTLALGMAVPAFAATTSQQAQAAAQKVVPEGSVLLGTEFDDGRFEVKFYNEARQESYEVKIGSTSGKIVSFDSELWNDAGSATVTLTEDDAKQAVLGEFEGAEILSVYLHRDDGLRDYRVSFQTDALYGEIKVHPQTGAILERDLKIGTRPSQQTGGTVSKPSTQPSTQPDGLITLERAREIARAQVPGATLVKCKLDRDDGLIVYEGELYKDGWEYEFTIDAKTGRIIEWEQDYDD